MPRQSSHQVEASNDSVRLDRDKTNDYLMAFPTSLDGKKGDQYVCKESLITSGTRILRRRLFFKSRQNVNSSNSFAQIRDRHTHDIALKTRPDLVIRELHSSIVGDDQRHCILVNDQTSVRVLATSSETECQAWLNW